MNTELGIKLGILLVLLVGSGFFSMSETALMALSKIDAKHMVSQNIRGAKLVAKLLEDPARLLSSILVGNNLVNIGASSLATVLATDAFGDVGAGIATGAMTLLVLIFGEITPKTIASNNSEKVSIAVSKPIRLIIIVLSPIVWVFNIITGVIFKILRVDNKSNQPYIKEEELKTMVNVSHEEGVLEIEEREMINNVFQFGDMQTKEAMVQRLDIVSIDSEDSYNEIINIFKEEKITRMPVYEESIDDIIGILNIKDIIFLSKEEIDLFNIKDLSLKDVNINYIDMPDSLKKTYQYYTAADMSWLKRVKYPHKFHTLEEGVADYVKNYLLKEDQYLSI